MSQEHERLKIEGNAWRHWGPYLSERAWGTVREDYSPDGTAWDYFSHDQSRSRTYRWNEDGLGGISNDKGRMCFAQALWNGRDPHWCDYLLFYEYFQGDDGAGIGASHQTGWTGLVAKLIQQQGEAANTAEKEDLPEDFLTAGE